MIKKDNFSILLEKLNFTKTQNIYIKKFPELKTELRVNFDKQELIYPEKDGFRVNERQTCNFKQAENFVVFECVHRLLNQGYSPKHIELEPKWQLGHGASGGRADILVKDNDDNALLIIECKTAGSEFTKAWNSTQVKPTQLFSYVQQAQTTKFIALYASDLVDGKVKADYYLINLCDNKKLLENNKELKAYSDANRVEEIYEVWSRTYQKDYATIGLFEDTQAYHIGKEKYALKDLKTVTSRDIQGKYHQFATIMRQHNVSGRENAFDKLVNLFLCKVVDEANNPNELKFYWKGVAYDDPFSLQDRLNHLYKVGMKQFLGEDITYIENSQIDDAFSVFRDKPNMTKEIIQGFFKELKFFTNSDFAFVDVHNEELFYQNFEVLLKVVKMLQDIKLTGGEDNQFLGDMFEGFLDQGVKQSEGQFFTPMPIVKFIINSLPLDKIANPKAIDYACGAGHFLNEVANNFSKEYHKNIVGIEKEYRLSKVAKVSSFMYGQDDVKIVYHDALAPCQDVKNNDYSILVANPPYSVKGFLETLKPKDRERYQLIKTLDEKSFITNNAIECFFIERAKQLLKKDAVAGVILPSSILSKGSGNNIYVKTREILLKYFEIIAIAEFGSGTFGKTGTNTVTLFLKRRSDNPNMQKHLKYMVNSWFEGDFSSNELFNNSNLLANYCEHIETDLEQYKKLLQNKYTQKLFESEMFMEYSQEFQKLSETKKRKKQKYYKALTSEAKEKQERRELLKYIRTIEEDKLYYFSLAYLNQKEIIIVKAPTDGVKNKKFLGYEWSGRKGDEGIKYITSEKAVKLEGGEDIEILENILNLNNIQTPLYNPKDKNDTSKINSLIAKNFGNEIVEIPKELEGFVSKARLVDMLDFSRKEFNKAIGLSPKRKAQIIGKIEWQVKISDICELGRGRVINKHYIEQNVGDYPIYSSQTSKNGIFGKINTYDFDGEYVTWTTDGIYAGTCTYRNGKFNCTNVCGTLKSKNDKLKMKFLPYVLNEVTDNYVIKTANPKLMNNVMATIKIPLPPLKIQEKIIKKCELIDDEVVKANIEVEKSEKEIISIMGSDKNSTLKKLRDICSMKAGKFVKASQIEPDKEEGLYPCYGGNGLRGYVQTFTHNGTYSIIGRQGALCGNITFVKDKFHATEHAVVVTPTIELDTKWLYHKLVIMNLNQYATGVAQPGLSVKNLEPIDIEIPNLDTQKEIVQKIEILEAKISKAKTIIAKASSRKEAVLREFL